MNKASIMTKLEIRFHTKLDSVKILDCSSFEDIFISVVNNHVPVKTKIIRANNYEFMTKNLRKAIMRRSRLNNICLKN